MPQTKPTPPRPISLKVEPKTKISESALRDALTDLVRDDLDLSFTIDAESGETIIHGVSELHLDATVAKIFARGVGVIVGAPRVAYRESLARPADVDYTHKKQSGGTRQFARVRIKLEPNDTGKGNEFKTTFISGTVPKEYIPDVEKGVKSVWENGVLIGFPLFDMKVTLYGGAFHDIDSSASAFEIATRAAMKEGCEKGGIMILEPIMDVEVVTPHDCVGSIIGDLNASRAHIRTIEDRDTDAKVIRAKVPLALLFGYVSRLGSLSGGRASHSMAFSHYEAVPRNDANDPGTFPPAIGMRA